MICSSDSRLPEPWHQCVDCADTLREGPDDPVDLNVAGDKVEEGRTIENVQAVLKDFQADLDAVDRTVGTAKSELAYGVLQPHKFDRPLPRVKGVVVGGEPVDRRVLLDGQERGVGGGESEQQHHGK